jgi:Zn-dependent protease with chaperone function
MRSLVSTKNTISTAAPPVAPTALFGPPWQAFGGMTGMIVALEFAVAIHGAVHWFSDRLALSAGDARGTQPTGDPLPLAGSLQSLERWTWLRLMQVNPASASMSIVHPFVGGEMLRLFQTYPPVAECIARLEGLPVPSPA